MDSSKKITREPNPSEKANLLSKILFIFAFKTFYKGLHKEYEEDDVYETIKNNNSTKLGDLLEEKWKEEEIKKNPNIIFPLIKVFGKTMFILGVVYVIINTGLLVATPLLKGKVASYFTPNQTKVSEDEVYTYSFILISCTFVNVTFLHWYMYCIEELTLKVKISICALLYRKLLKLDSSLTSKVADGHLITIMTKDIIAFEHSIFLINKAWIGVIQTGAMIYLIYSQIGISAIIGFTALFLLIPLQVFFGMKTAKFRRKTAEKTDERIKVTQEILTVMKIIKMYAWELFFDKSVGDLRRKEIKNLRILTYLKASIVAVGNLNSRVALYLCIISYVAMGNHITAEKAFTVIGCFGALQMLITIFLPFSIAVIAELNVALTRISNFLLLEESNSKISNDPKIESDVDSDVIVEKTYVEYNDINILSNLNLQIKSGLTIITGSVGSGKSTLLKLLLGEVKQTTGTVAVSKKLSYASQEPWLFPGTIIQNIIFNQVYDEKRYNEVVDACALKIDFDDLPNKDMTIVIDKGMNLSRGQKSRINLARAIYCNADVYLLDDCLSAVDSNVSQHIFYQCFKHFLKNKTCILVCHQNQLLKNADSIVVLHEGSSIFQGDYKAYKNSNMNFIISNVNENDDKEHANGESNKEAGNKEIDEVEDDESTKLLSDILKLESKNIYEEKNKTGSVKKEVYLEYFKFGGGLKMVLVVIFFFIGTQIMNSWSDYFVSYWVDMEHQISEFKFNQSTNTSAYQNLRNSYSNVMKLYSAVIFLAVTFLLLRVFSFYWFSSLASVNIHNSIFNKIMNAGMIFFDTHLSGNVINRFSRDIGIIDEQMPRTISECARVSLVLLGILYVVSSVQLRLLVCTLIFLVFIFSSRFLYIPTSRSIRRLEGSTRSPVVGHINSTLEGLVTIRSNQAQKIIKAEFDKHFNLYNSCAHMHIFTTRAYGYYLDFLCVVYIAMITMSFLLFKIDTLAGKVGLALTQAYSLTGSIQWLVRQWADLENHMTSVERFLEYGKVKPEDKSGSKFDNWPKLGTITYQNVNLKYFENSDYVLKDISFTIESKQKIGIVGRTGAGKSSIIATLFKLYDFEGSILIDDVDIKTISIELLRTKISIIPQDPVLFSGTLRSNLDPYNMYSDKQLWDVLDEVEMKSTISNLNIVVNTGGVNFSAGQKQLLSLARALLENNIILVLDEATANIDPKTDSIIQNIIKNKFSHCSVITIAHRINTIIHSDQILVLEYGVLKEYDNPGKLLKNKNSLFYKIVKEANLQDQLN